MTDDDYAAIVRDMIKHENTLRDHRFSWMAILQGLLLTAAGLLTMGQLVPFLTICALGISVSLSATHSMKIGNRAIRSLVEKFHERVDRKTYDGPPVIGSEGLEVGHAWLKASRFLPRIMVLAWLLLAAYAISSYVVG